MKEKGGKFYIQRTFRVTFSSWKNRSENKWKGTKETQGSNGTLLRHWRQHPRPNCWPKAHPSLSGRPPWWWCGRWRRWRRGRYRSRRSPELLPFPFRSETGNLEMKEENQKNNRIFRTGIPFDHMTDLLFVPWEASEGDTVPCGTRLTADTWWLIVHALPFAARSTLN